MLTAFLGLKLMNPIPYLYVKFVGYGVILSTISHPDALAVLLDADVGSYAAAFAPQSGDPGFGQ